MKYDGSGNGGLFHQNIRTRTEHSCRLSVLSERLEKTRADLQDQKMPGYKWVPFTGMRATLPGMICAGRDKDGASLVVGRATHNGDVLPAKAKPEHAIAYVAYGGYEHEKRTFEILMPADFHWIPSRNGQVPHGAIESGRTNEGELLYVGRGFQQGTPTVGKVHPSHGCLYVPFGGREVALRDYEVLVQM